MQFAAIRMRAFGGVGIRPPTVSPFLRWLGAYLLLLSLGYGMVFWAGADVGLAGAVESALVNTVPILLLGFAAREILTRFVLRRPTLQQAALHLVMALMFSLVLYWVILSTFALLRGQVNAEFVVRPFPDMAGVWQLVHGVTVYALVAALSQLTYGVRSGSAAETEAATPTPDRADRLLVKRADEIVPIEVADIIAITGADDYSELVLVGGRHLSRMSLAEFDRMLPPNDFLRVHRSHIANVNRLIRAEPAGGGRMILHMEGGNSIAASRSGARRLRERTV